MTSISANAEAAVLAAIFGDRPKVATTAEAARSVAFAVWQAATGKSKLAAAEALRLAGMAVTAERRAGQPVVAPVDVAAQVAAYNTRAEARKVADALQARLIRAAYMVRQIQDWPSMGEPSNATERAAIALLAAHPLATDQWGNLFSEIED